MLRGALGLLVPGTGRRRATSHPATQICARQPVAPRTTEPGPPAARSPYGLDQGPFDGAASPLVRPYLVAVEREQARQSRRRLALVLAADFGIDLDRHVVGAEHVVAC
ncbi:hypothetical protein PV729_18920 [Streptomyces europaeiscabiei]|uniref:Uncharacterized protein n=1 Tax=Streptomyces europaeiscabiei TaxID=146819 RepID=A0ABU4NFM4_9ACTN|nr:hypothetical protein [Streptomyces europaeiscabiei]MDX2772262.1 hypothetical protein [Streptomyces europaeiscabiei]MDX3544468.1 hypothetical protein [Streptomyces europaeiscabiei]MDX3553817.1 hypothetical protein [Streptomyces europaeiscabiei]MDX3701935.1 hypothetical protein [Streptomyces europaeiscabiei]